MTFELSELTIKLRISATPSVDSTTNTVKNNNNNNNDTNLIQKMRRDFLPQIEYYACM